MLPIPNATNDWMKSRLFLQENSIRRILNETCVCIQQVHADCTGLRQVSQPQKQGRTCMTETSCE